VTSIDYDLLERWQINVTNFSEFSRKRPVRLRDREALGALVSAFEDRAGVGFSLMLDEVDYTYRDLDTLLDAAPPRTSVLHLQSSNGRLVVRLTSWRGGQSWVWATRSDGSPDHESLRRLVGIVEANSRPLGWRRIFSRSRLRVIRDISPSVITRRRRDETASRRFTLLNTAISAGAGFVAGALGAWATSGGN